MPSGKVKAAIVGVVVLAVLITVAVIIAKCFMKLETSQVAITYDTYTKDLNDQIYNEGLHIGRPTLQFIVFPSIFKTMSFSGKTCLNYDGVTVSLSVSMQYRLRPVAMHGIVKQFKSEDRYINILTRIASSAIHDVCCLYNTTQMQSERGRFQESLAEQFSEKFASMSTDVQDVQVNNIQRPGRYESAIRAKESSREDIQVATAEKPRLLTVANTTKREALSVSTIIKNQANSEAKILLQKALSEGEAILNEYVKEAESYKQLKNDNGLDNEGFLAYMGVRAIASAQNPVYVGMKAPAQTSYAQT